MKPHGYNSDTGACVCCVCVCACMRACVYGAWKSLYVQVLCCGVGSYTSIVSIMFKHKSYMHNLHIT